ncbi:MAG TPA: ATP-binding cassette domain-containing protein [Actinomycetaceae bacterium]|nr:ATP-binding cassette domain-containing protein [Actinomycetaceae bacterium]
MPVLVVDRVTKRYGQGRAAVTAVDAVSFTAEPGRIFGLLGPNGAGKTSLIRMIAYITTPDAGTIRFGEQAVGPATQRVMGYLPEERGLYRKLKVGEQLVYLARLHGMDAPAATRAMEQWTERLGVAPRRADHVEKLSLGNQQRVQLAAALVHDPEVLVLDEPFSGLDPVAVDVMSSVLRERAAAGVPVIFSSHQLDLVERLCDRVGIIRAGQMVALGTQDELRRTKNARWRAVVEGAAAGWARAVPGASVVSDDGREVVVELTGHDAGVEQPFLRAATAAGQLREFGPVVPTLTDLFRDVVTESDEKDAA